MKIISIINQKGGVGKSTTTLALAVGLKQKDYRVLLIDLDAQGNLSYTLNADPPSWTIMDVLTRQCSLVEAIVPGTADTPNAVLSHPALAGADLRINEMGKEYRLKEALGTVAAQYDYLVIDTPPAIGILTINALTAASHVIIPAQADVYSLQGIGQLASTLTAVKTYTNPQLVVLGILLTRYNPRSVLTRELTGLMADTAAALNTRLFVAKIRESVVVRESQASRSNLLAYAPNSNAAKDYEAFVSELLGYIEEEKDDG